jgi:serine/threonine-protein kinase HipA
MRRLGLPMDDIEQQFRRMVFNVLARNQDDHVKNIAFLMGRDGTWRLSPAYDLVFAHNPQGAWTAQHQMSLAGKRDGFDVDDLREVARVASMKRGRAEAILGEVRSAVLRWREFAAAARIEEGVAGEIAAEHRVGLGA